ncbi:DUF551 domain-containing protein [Escherichia coli]
MSTLTNDELFEEIMGRVNHLDVRDDIEYRAYEITLASLAAESVSVNDDMAYAFHHALSDSSLGADEVEEIKTGLRAAFANVSFPVTADGWISCSERMPAQDDWILIYSKHSEYMAGQVQGEYVELSDGTLSWLGNALFWMLLPEPPQEAGQ